MDKQQILHKAVDLYRNNFWKSPNAINYLTQVRGLKESTLFKFQVGYAKGNLVAITSKKEGWYDDAVKIGLVKSNGNDFFEDYIIFPVIDGNSYLNINSRALAPDLVPHKTLPNFSKDMLYNTQATNSNSVIIVESPIDVLTLCQNGFIACATMGINAGEEAIKRFKDKLCFILFDKDAAGTLGAHKLASKLVNVAKKIFIVEFPGKTKHKLDANSYFLGTESAKHRLAFLLKNSLPINPAEFTFDNKKKEKRQDWAEDKVSIDKVGRELFAGEAFTDKGNEIWVRCPHHKQGTEKKESLWIGGRRNIFCCFGCNTGGGPIRLVSWHLGISLEDAREWIRNRFISS